ncbi:MAG TPA: glycosyltransferase [Polyangiaceae bacterium]|nr:glycosyltransferase [Polyangiaceae bacterium]
MAGSEPADPTAEALRFSIVVPVFNEGANIGAYCRELCRWAQPPYELLVVYDFDEDDTLPALSALAQSDRPFIVRTVKNELGRGVRNAIETGLRAARAPVVVVSMADLSDDLANLAELVRRAELGAAVVCASRYARGGKQIGGPMVKALLSRAAGVSLHHLAGLPTADPTNSFKAYRRDFLERTTIESTAGFCLALELTVKAHFRGLRVEEVPATWRDRVAGKSNFRLVKWFPHYLRWYLWAFQQRYLGGG